MVEKPKYLYNGQLGTKFRIGMCLTTIQKWSTLKWVEKN